MTDFVLGSDRVQTYFGLVRDWVNWEQQQQFVKEVSPIENGKGTKLIVDLDGSGPGTQTYTLNLQNVAYNPNNTHTLFGV